MLEQEIPDVQVIQIVLDTEKEVLVERLKTVKKWDKTVIDFIILQREFFLDSLDMNQISLVVDTCTMSPKQVCNKVLKEIRIKHSP